MPSLITSRHRVRTDEGLSTIRVTTPSGVFTSEGVTFTYYEVSHDNVNEKPKDGLYPPSDFYHLVHRSAWYPGRPKTYLDGPPGGVVESTIDVFPDRPTSSRLDAEALWPVVPDGLWTDLAVEAFDGWSTQIPTEISIVNFLWELREWEDLIPKFEESLSKTVAGGYLTWEFGWKQLLQDLSTLSNLVGTVQAKIQHLREIQGRHTRLGFRRNNILSIPYIRDWVDVSANQQMRLSQYRADFIATGRLYANLTDLEGEASFWRAFAVALGLANPLKTFWNAVPFSFVVDWFSRAGSRLFNLTSNPFHGDWVVDRTTCSVKERIVVEARANYRPDLNGNPLASVLTADRYTRLGHLPLAVSNFTLETLSPQQQTLLLALLRAGVR